MSYEHLFNDFMQIIGPFMIIPIIFQILNHHLGPHEVHFRVNLTENPLFSNDIVLELVKKAI